MNITTNALPNEDIKSEVAFTLSSHTVIGTVVARTSNELTASNQKMIEENIINRLIKLD